MSGILFFIFASCEPLSNNVNKVFLLFVCLFFFFCFIVIGKTWVPFCLMTENCIYDNNLLLKTGFPKLLIAPIWEIIVVSKVVILDILVFNCKRCFHLTSF